MTVQSPLGKDANISANTYNLDAVSDRHKNKSKRFRMLGHAQNLLIESNVTSPRSDNPHRTRYCHAVRAYGQNAIALKMNDDELQSEASIGNVQTCGCIWSCPVCAARVSLEKARYVEKAMAWAEHSKLIPVMVTLTASHHAGMKLADFKYSFKSAYQLFTNRRKWREFKEKIGVLHHITNTEITYGDNGWHYHKHMLLFLDKSVIASTITDETLHDMLSADWLDCLEKRGLLGLEGIALKATTHGNIGEKYLTKLGIEASPGQLQYELTGQENKQGSTNIWDILRFSYYGDERMSRLYIEYVQAMTGENFLTCSHGLKDLLDEFEFELSETENEAEERMKIVALIHPQHWFVVKKAKIYHDVLDILARTRDPARVFDYIRDTGLELARQGVWLPTGAIVDNYQNWEMRE